MQAKTSLQEPGANGQSVDSAPTVVAREFHNFIADIEDLVKATTSLTGEELARARAKLSQRVATAKASVEQMGGAIADRARHTAGVTDDYVHDRPWQAVGIAAGVGVLVGFLIARRA